MNDEAGIELPPSLSVIPHIPFDKQTIDQLKAERDYWAKKARIASGWASVFTIEEFRIACENWINKREIEKI